MIPFREYHFRSLLQLFKYEKTPLDVLIRRYFRLHKALGSKDRAWIGETLYHYVRWKNVYDTLQLDPTDPLPNTDHLPLPLQLGTSEKLFNSLRVVHGEDVAISICQINQTRAPITIRVNPLKLTREELLKKLSTQFTVSPTTHSKHGILFDSRINFSALPEFKEGLFEVQDEASQLGSALVTPSLQNQILDYCAGAGGKSLAIAPHLQQTGQLYLHDIRPQALQEARRRLRRAGIQNAQFNLPPSKKSMDWIILDVPCSGTGTYRRNPDLKWKFDSLDLAKLIQEQRSIFDQALPYLSPKGAIVYMTCSILPEENEAQINYFQKKYDLEATQKFQTLPLLNGMDGFFAVSLKRK